ncbi:hypothetical protein ACFVU3_13585 [Streptomyces sp. NPDC058052]|uniref:hypothetical protein n=1 Tax=Streptomyces sp. NPDC058052 TaxID=3346316 RepID=UPI0036E9BE43
MDWLLTDGVGILIFWWLVFAGCNVLRGVYCLVRDRRRQRMVRAITARGADPVRAAYLAGDVGDAAEAAVLVLAADRLLRVADDGGLRLASPGRVPREATLAAFIRGVGSAPGVKVYEIPDHPRFEEFLTLLRAREPDIKLVMTTGLSRPLIVAFAALSAFALGLHARLAEAPVPFEENGRPAAWIFWVLIDWMAMTAVALLWPRDGGRRWPELDAHCREQVEHAREAVPRSTRHAVITSKHRPRPAPKTRQAGRRRNSSWADDIDGDSCGGDSCGGCGGE